MNRSQTHWRQIVSRLIKSELTKRGLKYEELSQKLQEIGISQTADNLRNKINRGVLGADLLFQIAYVLELSTINKPNMDEILSTLLGPST